MFYGRFWGGKGLLICVCDKKNFSQKPIFHCDVKRKKNSLLEIDRNIQPIKNIYAPKETIY